MARCVDAVTTAVIATHSLSRHYRATVELDGLDLTVAPGEVYGFLGPNGAGKATAIRLLLGLHRPYRVAPSCSGYQTRSHGASSSLCRLRSCCSPQARHYATGALTPFGRVAPASIQAMSRVEIIPVGSPFDPITTV